MDFLKSLISALPTAAVSPYAFVAYLCVVVSWTVVALKVKRNAQLLAHLNSLPSRDRLKALQLEMGSVQIKESMTPEQWIKAQVHKYFFLGFAILCLAAVIIIVVAFTVRRPGTADVDITPYNGPIKSLNQPAVQQQAPEQSTSSTLPSVSNGVAPQVTTPETTKKVIKSHPVTTSPEPYPVDAPVYAPTSFRKGGPDDSVDNKFDDSSGSNIYGSGSDDFILAYDYDRTDSGIVITPQMPYLSLLSKGGPISGVHYWYSAFAWQFPRLSIKIVNNTDKTLELTEATIRVNKSETSTDPVILIHESMSNVGHLAVVNEGWGSALKPAFKIGIIDRSGCSRYPTEDTPITFSRDTLQAADNLPIIDYVPSALKSADSVCVFGIMQFLTESGDGRSLKFYALASLKYPGPGAPAPPEYLYDVFLESGRSGYTRRIPISEMIKPGDVDHFLIRVGTDKSATFNLSFSFISKPAPVGVTTNVALSVFVPRSQSNQTERRTIQKDDLTFQPSTTHGTFCADAQGNKRCKLADPGHIGVACYCPEQGWGTVVQ